MAGQAGGVLGHSGDEARAACVANNDLQASEGSAAQPVTAVHTQSRDAPADISGQSQERGVPAPAQAGGRRAYSHTVTRSYTHTNTNQLVFRLLWHKSLL